MSILLRFLIRNYLLGCLPVLLALGTLFSFLVFAEELENVGEGLYQTRDALFVTLLTLPSRVLDLLPVTLLLGGLFGLGTLARHHEIVVLRAAGLSLAQLAGPIVLVAVTGIMVVAGLRLYVVPDFELRAVQLRAKTENTEIMRDKGGTGYWMRSGDQLLHINELIDGHLLTDIEIYYLDDREKVSQMIHADKGEIVGPREWILHGVETHDFSGARLVTANQPQSQWSSRLTRQQTASLVVPLEALSTVALYRHMRLLDSSGLDSQNYRVVFWQQISQLLAVIIMALLSLPFVLGVQRGGGLARSALIGGIIGIAFYLFEQLTGQLSALIDIAPMMAAILPEALMGLLTVYLFRKASLN